MAENKPIGLDPTGYEVLTKAVKDLLNTYPGLDGQEIKFENIGKESGICFSADNGALIMTERRSVTDHVWQRCQYPFYIVYRTATDREQRKINVQTFLDTLGKWLCHEKIQLDGQEHRIDYPVLTDNRKIEKVTRNNSYGLDPSEDGVQDWLLPCVVEYTNEFDD